MRTIFVAFVFMTLCPFTLAWSQEATTPVNQETDAIAYLLDFTDYSEGPVEDWLESKGFKLERDAKNRSRLDLDVNGHSLTLEAKRPVQAFLVDEAVNVQDYSKIRIEWGINKYPKGASYAKKINNEALMLYIFFGTDKISSGSYLIPNSPYFIALFLCQDEKVGFPYKGSYFHKGGRFVCLGKPKPQQTVLSEFDLVRAFKRYFKNDEVPGISGISLAVDTKKSGDKGRASAFIKSVKFLE